MPLTVADSLTEDDVLLDLTVSSKKHVLETLSGLLSEKSTEFSADQIFDALVERERLGCTAADFGLAIPHARLPDISTPVGIFARLSEPVNFDGKDVPDVDLLFCFVLPEITSDSYDSALQALAAELISESTCDSLRGAPDKPEILAILRACGENAVAAAAS